MQESSVNSVLRELPDKNAFGKKVYAFDGAIPLAIPDVSDLEYGDTVIDCDGQGMRLCVNQCCKCDKKYLRGTLVLVEQECPQCENEIRYEMY